MMNVVILGFYAEFRGYAHEDMSEVIKESAPPQFHEGNLRAFELGTAICRAQLAAG
jgi:indolepyruvate ferredoxin oxidoreductase beta subunit